MVSGLAVSKSFFSALLDAPTNSQAELPYQAAFEDFSAKLSTSLPLGQVLEMTQRELSETVDRAARVSLLESAPTIREKARLRCLA